MDLRSQDHFQVTCKPKEVLCDFRSVDRICVYRETNLWRSIQRYDPQSSPASNTVQVCPSRVATSSQHHETISINRLARRDAHFFLQREACSKRIPDGCKRVDLFQSIRCVSVPRAMPMGSRWVGSRQSSSIPRGTNVAQESTSVERIVIIRS